MIALLLCLPIGPTAPCAAVPWWDDYPTTVQTGDPQTALALGCDSCLCGIADDPCWGIYGARCRYFGQAPRVAPLRDAGVKILTWVETFGTCEQYIAEFERGPDGKLVGYEADPTTPRPVLNHWGWHTWRLTEGRVCHWIGLGPYYEDEAWVRPWTRTHPRYGAPAFRYPDGREAAGYTDGPGGLPIHRLHDAGCSKDVLGELWIHYGDNATVNEVDPTTGEVRGPTEGLVPHETADGIRWAGLLSFGKDFACPHWIEYARASARQVIDFGVEGIWADNFSAWDGLGNPPVRTAFGEWSVHRFREHLQGRFTGDQLREMGVDDHPTFDVRTYLRCVMRETMGGDDTKLTDPGWRDPRWLDDPIWREYLIFKLTVGREALKQFHDAFHTAAREAGIEDFAIQGNDVPIWSFGMPRPESLEMVSTEFGPGWNLLAGPRGIGLPPRGRLNPVIKMARVHQRGRFVHLWYYLDGLYAPCQENAAVGRVLSYELLANHAMIQAYPSQKQVAGTIETHREAIDFIHASKTLWGDRQPLARIGLVYSPSSRLADLTPGGIVDFGGQQHAFDLIGWGTALSELHLQYTVIPEWELTARTIEALDVLLLPSVKVLSSGVVRDVLRPWVADGGTLVLSGPVGERHGAERRHERVDNPAGMLAELCELAGISPKRERPERRRADSGSGLVVLLPALGFEYYQTDPALRQLGKIAAELAADVAPHGVVATDLPRELEVSVFASPSRTLLFVDIANLDLDPDAGDRPDPQEVTLTLAPPGRAVGDLRAEVLRPGREADTTRVHAEGGRMTLGPLRLEDYTSIAIEGWSCQP